MSHFVGEEHPHEATGLARDIRASVVSDQFDLGGYTEQRAKDLIYSAFKTPFSAPTEMIKITLVVGGGKLVRARYSDELPKWIMTFLRDVGYTEDKSAAETFDSQGTFKHQHDIGQNLKYVIVYPYVDCANAKASSSASTEEGKVDTSSPDFTVVTCDISTFQEILNSKVQSYHQKKKLLKHLQSKQEEFKTIEAKLISGHEKLTDKEQFIYDSNPGNDQEKLTILQNALKEMVDHGQLTQREKKELLKSIEGNLYLMQNDIDSAKAENKPKKVENLTAKKDVIIARKALVEKINPIQPRLIYGDDIRSLYWKLYPLASLEEKSRSISLTMADLKQLEEKSNFEEEIKKLQEASKGWFEDLEDFNERCHFEETEAKRTYKPPKVSKKPSSKSSGSKSSSSNWSTVTSGNKVGGSTLLMRGGYKPPPTSYAAAFDSDSDD
jgi:hypothetical protein